MPGLLKPYSTLAVGIVIGWLVLPRVMARVNLPAG